MKKDEIVVLSNDIEIINGIEIDWSKFKGRNDDRARKGYIGLCELLHKNGHKILGGYKGALKKILIDFNCGHEPHSIAPNNYKQGYGCPICAIKNKMDKSKEELYKLAKENSHKILGEYKGNKTKILIDFNCGHEPHSIAPNNYKNGHGCPVCAIKNKMDKSKEELYKLAEENGHIILGEYKGTDKKILIDFNCGHEPHSIVPNAYKKGYGCPICGGTSPEYAKEEFYKFAKENNHTILGEYKNNSTKILIDFNCGHKPHNIRPHDYKQGYGCPICGGNSPEYAKEEFYKFAKENNHTILGEYKNNSTKILIDFNCGHEPHSIAPNNYKNGHGCPKCKASKGEGEVARILKEMNIEHQEQYRFENCRNVLPLPFDFYISELNLCIEYDGKHHYEPVAYYKKDDSEYKIARAKNKAEERLKETQYRDKIKTDYCRKNGINLIRIPYWEFDNIEEIIKKELGKHTKKVA